MWWRVLELFARVSPVTAGATPELDTAVMILDADVSGTTILEAAIGLLILGAVGSVAPAVFGWYLGALAVLAFAGVLAAGIMVIPQWLATARETRALGELPDLIGFGVLRMRVDPSLEQAAGFAAEHASGPLAASLTEHRRRARGTPETGWNSFAKAWSDDVPSLRRATSLLGAAAAAESPDRATLLDDALSVVLDGTRNRMAAYAAELRGPTTGLYAFGVVLPLAFIGALPTLQAAGIPIQTAHLAFVYNGVLPVGLVIAGAWLVGRRPAAFPPAAVASTHPAVPSRTRQLCVAVPVTASIGLGVSWALFPWWSPWIVVPAVTLGVATVVWYRPVSGIREEIDAIETGLPSAMRVVGQHLSRGMPPEAAIGETAETVTGPTSQIFDRADGVHDRVRIGVEAAFRGEYGALEHIASPRVDACAALLALAGRTGPHGGSVVGAFADHLESLQRVEADARREIGTIVGTLRSTGYCFAPLIGGATVALATRLDGVGVTRSVSSVDPGALAVVVGVYVLMLAVVLVGLAAALERGFDRAVIGEEVGAALAVAGIIYPMTVIVAGWLV